MSSLSFGRRRGLRALPLAVVFAAAMLAMPKDDAEAAAALIGEWRPVEIGTAQISPGTKALLRFGADGRISGVGGCNRFAGQFSVAGSAISLSPIGSTRMACAPSIMREEQAFFTALKEASGFQQIGANLVLLDEAGVMLAQLVPAHDPED